MDRILSPLFIMMQPAEIPGYTFRTLQGDPENINPLFSMINKLFIRRVIPEIPILIANSVLTVVDRWSATVFLVQFGILTENILPVRFIEKILLLIK